MSKESEDQVKFHDRYLRGETTVEDDARMKRIAELQGKQKVIFSDRFLEVPQDKALENTRSGYLLNRSGKLKEGFKLAPEVAKFRQYNRDRIICGPLDLRLNDNISHEICVMTTNGINLMGTSPDDLKNFSNGAGQLKEDEYRKEMERIADFVVSNAKAQSQSPLVMPAFGVGVYIDKLDDKSKEKAREIMFKAFMDAAKKHEMQVEVVANGSNHKAFAKVLRENQGNQYINLEKGDIFDRLKHHKDTGHHPILLNPGSDRTVGGKYVAMDGDKLKDDKTLPLEEQITRRSNLIELHAEYNEPLKQKFMKEFQARKMQATNPDAHSVEPPKKTPVSPPPLDNKWHTLKMRSDASDKCYKAVPSKLISLADVEKHLKKGEVPLSSATTTMVEHYMKSSDSATKKQAADMLAIYSVKQVMGNLNVGVKIDMVDNSRAGVSGHDNHAMKVSFATQAEAEDFSKQLLKEYGIHSLTFGTGTMKKPQNGSIYLTKDDLDKISLATKVTREPGSGAKAYTTKADEFVNSKLEALKKREESPPEDISHRPF